jgi:hypothetical protein
VIDASASGACAFSPFMGPAYGQNGDISVAVPPMEDFSFAITTAGTVRLNTPALVGTPTTISGSWTPRSWTSLALAAQSAMQIYLFDSATNKVYRSSSTTMWDEPSDAGAPANVRSVGSMSSQRMMTLMSDGTFQELAIDSAWTATDLPYTLADFGLADGTLADPNMTSDGLNLVFAVRGAYPGIYGATRSSLSARFGPAILLAIGSVHSPQATTCHRMYAVDDETHEIVLYYTG